MDRINRQAAIAAIRRHNGVVDKSVAVRILTQLPGEVPGQWERHYSRPGVYADLFWHCSKCGYKNGDNWGHKYRYCPGCGSPMKPGEE